MNFKLEQLVENILAAGHDKHIIQRKIDEDGNQTYVLADNSAFYHLVTKLSPSLLPQVGCNRREKYYMPYIPNICKGVKSDMQICYGLTVKDMQEDGGENPGEIYLIASSRYQLRSK